MEQVVAVRRKFLCIARFMNRGAKILYNPLTLPVPLALSRLPDRTLPWHKPTTGPGWFARG